MSSTEQTSRRSFVPHFVAGFLATYGTYTAAYLLGGAPEATYGLGARLGMLGTSALVASVGALLGAALVHRAHRRTLAEVVNAGRTALAGALAGVGGVVLGAAMNGTRMPMPVEVPAPVLNALGMGVGLALFAALGAGATRLLYAPWLRGPDAAPTPARAERAALAPPAASVEPNRQPRAHAPREG
jgi:hypothetical protein